MANFQTTLFPLIVDEIGAVPEPLLQQHVNEVVRDFCSETCIWFETLDLQLVDGQRDYTFAPTDDVNTEFVLPKDAWWVKPTTPEETLRFLEPRWDYITENKAAWTIRLGTVPADPEVDEVLRIAWALRPTRAGTDIDDRVLSDWRTALAYGVKARLMLMPGRHWTNPQAANLYRIEYIRGIRNCRYDQARNQTAGDVHVHYPQGYRF